jgi:hypothetical protein
VSTAVFDLTGSAAAVGVLTSLSRGPGMALSVYGGDAHVLAR